jgi:hypothetical protein
MTRPIPRDVLLRIRRLAQLPEEVRKTRWAVSITRLTVLKSLCKEPDVASRFVTYLGRRTAERVREGKGRSPHRGTPTDHAHQALMAEALNGMDAWQRGPTEELRRALRDLLGRMRAEQNEYENIAWGAVRLVSDWELLLFEYALSCLLGPATECGYWAYQTARHYAERYTPSQGTGLISSSAPLVQDVADFWTQEYDLGAEAVSTPAGTGRAKRRASAGSGGSTRLAFTHRQGQFLAFIHLYRKLHRRGPAEAELVRYFGVTPPSVHSMVVRLEELGLITREAGAARSMRVTVPAEQLPTLDEVAGPPW